MLLMLTMLPPECISFAASMEQSHAALALTLRVQSQCFSVNWSAGRFTPVAALFTRMSSPPNASPAFENRPLMRAGVAEVCPDSQALNAVVLDLLLGFGGFLVSPQVIERYVDASARQLQSDGPSYAPRASSHERGLALERHLAGP